MSCIPVIVQEMMKKIDFTRGHGSGLVKGEKMILYFTGTGNSKFVADVLADVLGDKVVSLNHLIKDQIAPVFDSEKPFVVVAPIYAWRYPRVVVDLLKKAKFSGSKDLYFIATMGSETGDCEAQCRRLCISIGMKYKGFCGVPMPDNFVTFDVMPTAEQAREKIARAVPVIRRLAYDIAAGAEIKKTDRTLLPLIKSGMINRMFRHFDETRSFVISDDCTSCGLCEKLCPVNNIVIFSDKPRFGNRCVKCYSCIQHCPKQALNIKGRTENHGRYVCPEYRKQDWK